MFKRLWNVLKRGETYQKFWDAVKDVTAVLWPARFSIAVVAISLPFLFFLGPSQDAMRAAIGQHHSLTSKLCLALICLLWAIETFYWAYFMSRLPALPKGLRAFPDEPLLTQDQLDALNRDFCFWFGLATLLIAGGAASKANWDDWTSVALIVLATVADGAVYVFFTRRVGVDRLTPLIHLLLKVPTIKDVAPLTRLRDAHGVHHRRDLFPLPAGQAGQQPVAQQFTLESRPSRLVIGGMVALTLILYWAFGGNALGTRQAVAVLVSLGWFVAGCFCVARLAGRDMPWLTKFWVLFNFAIFTAVFIISLYAPPVLNGAAPSLVTAPLVMFSAFCAWVFFGTFFFALPAELFRLPVTTMILAAALIVSIVPGDNHDVRRRDVAPPRPQPLAEAFAQWYGQWDAEALKKWDNLPPLVIVATAGGASRAGYWTAKVLGELEAAYLGFHHHVFAVSSVSGGTVGAGLWRAMLQNNDRCQRQAVPGNGSGGTYVNCARLFFCQDFLGPLFLDGLYADLTQRILPGRLLPDRAVALEQSWEQAWANMMHDPAGKPPATEPTNPMLAAFHDLVADPKDWRPLLLANGTSEKSGRRIITSQLAIDRDEFPDAIDFFVETGTELNLSTALHNSARFTYLDAAGNIAVVGPDNKQATNDRILDGGYFENFGANTAFDLLQAIDTLKSSQKFRPVIIQISADPGLETDGSRQTDWETALDRWPPDLSLTVAADAQAPLVTLYNTRDAHGIRATKLLKNMVSDKNYAHFRLTDKNIPMSWAMSGEVIHLIDEEWTPSPPKSGEKTNPNEKAKGVVAGIFGAMPANTVSDSPNPPCGGL